MLIRGGELIWRKALIRAFTEKDRKKRNRNLKTAGYKLTEACEVKSLNRKETIVARGQHHLYKFGENISAAESDLGFRVLVTVSPQALNWETKFSPE